MAIRVLHLCAVDFTLAKFLAPFCFFLKGKGFDVTAACTESVFMEPLREQGLRCVNLPIERSTNLPAHARSYLRLSAWLRDERFDIVHVHTPIAALIGRLAAARRHVPIRIYTAHGFYFHDDMASLKRRADIALERFGARFHDYLFTQSEEDRIAAIREGIARAERVRTIGNGVDVRRFAPERFSAEDRLAMRASLGIPGQARVLAVIGRLVREKGYFELFRASAKMAARFPDFRLLVIGAALESDYDNSTHQLHALIDELRIRDRIIFTGQRTDVPALLHVADVFTLPSYREGMPRSVIEAMAMALPAVVTNIRGCREEVMDGETGYIVPTRDAAALADRCGRLLSDLDACRAMGRAAHERAERFFSEDLVFERQMEIYEQLLREKGITR